MYCLYHHLLYTVVMKNEIKSMNKYNLNKLKIETIDYSKLNSLSNDKLKIEQFKKVIKE
jgi:hypothetical protein